MANPVGALHATLSLAAAQFIADLGKSRKAVRRFSNDARKDMNAFEKASDTALTGVRAFGKEIAAGLTLGALTLLFNRSVETADAIGKMSRTLGLTAEDYQAYAFGAELAGIAQSQFNSNMTAFVKRLGEAENGIGPLVSGLKNNNKALLDALRNADGTSDALDILATAMQNTASATDRAALANAAFSRAGVNMGEFLKDGPAGLKRFREEANRLGFVLSNEMVAAAERTSDALDLAGKAISVNLSRAMLTLAPLVIRSASAFAEATPEIAKFLDSMAPDSVASVETLQKRLDATTASLRAMLEVARAEGIPLDVESLRLSPLGEEIGKILARRDDLRDYIETAEAAAAATALLLGGGEGGNAAAQAQAEAIGRVTEALQFELEQVNRNSLEKRVATELRKAGLAETDKEAQGIIRLVEAIELETAVREANKEAAEEQAEAQRDAAARFEQIVDSTMTSTERLQAEIDELNELWRIGASQDAEAYRRALERLQEQMDNVDQTTKQTNVTVGDVTKSVFSGLTDALNSNAKTWQDWAKIALDVIEDVAISFINSMNKVNATGKTSGGGGGFGSFFSFDLSEFFGFAQHGGLIVGPGGPTGDKIPFMGSAGEFIVNARAARDNLPLLERMNSGRLRAFAAGGLVGARAAPASASFGMPDKVEINIRGVVDRDSIKMSMPQIKRDLALGLTEGRMT